jgi:hypothetical protein
MWHTVLGIFIQTHGLCPKPIAWQGWVSKHTDNAISPYTTNAKAKEVRPSLVRIECLGTQLTPKKQKQHKQQKQHHCDQNLMHQCLCGGRWHRSSSFCREDANHNDWRGSNTDVPPPSPQQSSTPVSTHPPPTRPQGWGKSVRRRNGSKQDPRIPMVTNNYNVMCPIINTHF